MTNAGRCVALLLMKVAKKATKKKECNDFDLHRDVHDRICMIQKK